MAFGNPSSQTHQAPKAPREVTLKPPRFGVCVFNSPDTPTSGVACVYGQRPQEFNSRLELPSDVIWISTAKGSTIAQNFREASYLRTTPKHIADDLGVLLADPVDGLPLIAETISRVRDMAVHAYPWVDIATDWSEKTLGASINKLLNSEQRERMEHTESIFRQAYQPYSFVPDAKSPGEFNSGYGIFSLRVNRLRYADWICGQTYPGETWYMMKNDGAQMMPIDAFLDPQKPCIVEASIEFLNRDATVPPSLVAFGSSSMRPKQTLRSWISQPELAWLVNHANVHVSAAIVANGAVALPSHLQLPRLLTADPVYALSLAAGILAESHWTGLSTETFTRRPGPSGTARFVSEVRPVAIWMRAYDRAYTFQLACAVQAKGYVVTNYGYGAVNFWAPKDRLAEIEALAEEIGACHPNLAAVHDRMFSDVSSEG